MSNIIVQYVLLRSDLLKELGWSIGALVAQACHASTAVLHIYRDDEYTTKYLNELDSMHKVVLEDRVCITHNIKFQPQTVFKGKFLVSAGHLRDVEELRTKQGQSSIIQARIIRQTFITLTPYKTFLEVPNEDSLRKLADKLSENSIDFKLWIEQPENIPTCLALKPYPKEEVKKFVGKFKLYKTTLPS